MRENAGRAVAAATLLLALSMVSAPFATASAQGAGRRETAHRGPVYRIPLDGSLGLSCVPFVERSLRDAKRADARAVVLELGTPGGRLGVAQHIVDAVGATNVPVYAFVNRRALSAGALVALSTDGVYMVPGAVIGASNTVVHGDVGSGRIMNVMSREMQSLAREHGLDPRVAQAMVDPAVALPGVVTRGSLLALTTREAVNIGFAHRVDGWDGLMQDIGDAGAPVVTTHMNWLEGLVGFATNPIVTPVLLALGFLGVLVEIKAPTFGVAGLLGAVSLALFFGGHYLVGLAGSEELVLLVVGLVLLGIEVFVIPGFGVFGVLGIAGIGASIYLSLVGKLATFTDYTHAAAILSTSIIVVAVVAWALLRHLPSSRRLLKNGIFLGESTNRDTGYLSSALRPELVGRAGVAVTDLHPAGVGRFDDERLDVVAEEGWIQAGAAIRVVRAEGYRHVVRLEDELEAKTDHRQEN